MCLDKNELQKFIDMEMESFYYNMELMHDVKSSK